MRKLKHLLEIILLNIHPHFETYENHLAHVGTAANIQNSYVKLSGFRLDISILLLYREIIRNILCLKKSSSTPEIFSQFFMTNLLDLLFSPPFDCGLNETNNAFSGKTNIYQKVF